MALTENMSAADLAAVVGNNNDGFGGNNGAWWLLILLIFANNGWGGNGFGGNGGAIPYMTGLATQSDIQNGFDQAAIMSGINGITSVLSNGFANSEISRTNMLSALTNQINSNAMMQQQSACDSRAGIADLKYTVATEACADRNAISQALRDVIEANTNSTQRILDQMCQDKIDAKNEQIANLQQQLAMANLAASQNAQTAAILANNEAQTAALEQYLQPPVRPAYIVPAPFQSFNGCGCNSGCGCNV